jgi:hypothetical protein
VFTIILTWVHLVVYSDVLLVRGPYLEVLSVSCPSSRLDEDALILLVLLLESNSPTLLSGVGGGSELLSAPCPTRLGLPSLKNVDMLLLYHYISCGFQFCVFCA